MKGLLLVASAFGVLTLSATAGYSYTFDSNVPTAIREQTAADLAFMYGVTSENTSGLHKTIFGPVAGASYKAFFETRVMRIGLSDCGSSNAVACVIPFKGSDKIWFTPNYTKFSHPQIARLMVVFHESRHTEVRNRNWPHANCPKPFLDEKGQPKKSIWTGAPLAGEPACDITPMGSYGSSMILLKNLSKYCANCTEKVREDAGIYADDQFGRVTNATAREQIINDLYK